MAKETKFAHTFSRREFPSLDRYLQLKQKEKEIKAELDLLSEELRNLVKALPDFSYENKYAVNGALTIAANETNSIDLEEFLRVLEKPREERLWLPSAIKVTPGDKKVAEQHGLLVKGLSELVIRVSK